jgi:hypothetical protein
MSAWQPLDQAGAQPAVELIEVDEDWYVRIIDSDGRETVNSFPMESFAVSFAEEYCRRLGLADFDRL